MQITFKSFKEFGDCFVIRDFQRETSDYDEDNMLFGLVLSDEDDMKSIKTALKLGMGNNPSIVMIELCLLTGTQENIDKVIEIKNFIREEYGDYTDMDTYESRLTYGLMITDFFFSTLPFLSAIIHANCTNRGQLYESVTGAL